MAGLKSISGWSGEGVKKEEKKKREAKTKKFSQRVSERNKTKKK